MNMLNRKQWIRMGTVMLVLALFAAGGLGILSYTQNISQDIQAVVLIDPGHGGYDSGAVGPSGACEKDIALDLSLKIGRYLEKNYPIQVLYTRDSDEISWPEDEAADLQERACIAQNSQADLVLSVHLNSSENTDATGYFGIIRSNDLTGMQVLSGIYEQLEAAGWSEAREMRFTDSIPLYLVDNVEMPAILLETGFISNAAEERALSSGWKQNLLAKAIAKGIGETLLN